jgi:osmotically-inducible protein OsmY
MKRLAKIARTPMTAAAWWAALWAWRNRPTVSQWTHFGWQAVRTRRSPRDVALEVRVRAALARDPLIRRSSEVQVESVRSHVVHLVGVPGGEDTEQAALAAARVRGVTAVDLHDKVAIVDRDGDVIESAAV